MKYFSLWVLLAALAAVMTAGCGHLNLVPIGEPERVLTGTVNLPDGVELPPGTAVSVSVIDESNASAPLVLGEQTLNDPAPGPIAFRVEYNAEDTLLRLGLNIEVRVSYGGKVRYSNVRGSLVTANDADAPHDIRVESSAQ
jgi:uncharacterized lipoprotein YbaY